MEPSDPTIHSFIVKVWLETARPDGPRTAHGSITHVPGEEKMYLTSLDDISAYIARVLGSITFNERR